MSSLTEKGQGSSEVIERVEDLLRSGQADTELAAARVPAEETVTKLLKAEELDADMLRLMVTI